MDEQISGRTKTRMQATDKEMEEQISGRTKTRMQAAKPKLFPSLLYMFPKGLYFTLFCNQLPPPRKKKDGEKKIGAFPSSPVVRTRRFHCHGPGSIPGQGTEIPQAA